ncbi:uncharacterized protein LOC128385586 [Panonychus citri]|uniref:uncharacterized protein LOC128385586 n=1 Tax=Panonychus citri TaxID=50023 RepID=UPI0023075EA7|nr:uncharacterized protein LOC128385586 [Panonychus citri]
MISIKLSSNNQQATLYEYYIDCNQFFKFLEISMIRLKLFQLIGLAGLISQIYKLLVNLIVLYKETIATENSFFNEHNNRALFNTFTTIDQIFIFHDWITFNPFTFCNQFDSLWKLLPFSIRCRTIIETKLSSCRTKFIIISLANLILCYAFLFHDPLIGYKKVDHLTYIMKVISILGYGYSCLIVFHLMVTGIFLHSSLICLSNVLDSLVYKSKVTRGRRIDLENGQHGLGTKTILFYRNVYQQLGQLVEITDSSHRLFIGTFYLSCVPKFVTIVYDIAFTEATFKTFHITEACVNLIRLFIITDSIARIPSFTSSFWKTIYRLTIVSPNNSAMIEANLFLERIRNHSHGIKIFNKKLITPAIVPTMITAIITYFIAISSINRGQFVPDNDNDFGDDD